MYLAQLQQSEQDEEDAWHWEQVVNIDVEEHLCFTRCVKEDDNDDNDFGVVGPWVVADILLAKTIGT